MKKLKAGRAMDFSNTKLGRGRSEEEDDSIDACFQVTHIDWLTPKAIVILAPKCN